MNSFTLLTGFAFALEPRVGYGQFLSATLRRLLAQTSHGLTRYGAGRDAASQAAAADDIAAAYAAAAKQFSTITALSVSPQDVRVHNALREALTAAGSAYINLATATRNRNLAAWRDAHGKVVAAVDQLGAELDELQKLGYSLG